MGTRNVFLLLLFIGIGNARVQLKISRPEGVPYALCTNNDTPDEDCSSVGVFAMDRCDSASLQIDVSKDEVSVVSGGETLYATHGDDAPRIMRYINRIFCDKPVQPILIKRITYKEGSDVWVKLGPRLSLTALNNSEGEEFVNKSSRVDVMCLRLEEISVNVPEGYDINKFNRENITALVWAIGFGDLESVQKMVANGANLNQFYLSANLTAGHLASGTCNDEVLKFLISKGVSVDVASDQGRTPLHVACHEGSLKVAKVLLNTFKGNVNSKDDTGRTALHYAAMVDDPELIDLLLSSGANIMDKDTFGFTALHFAAGTPRGKSVEKLVSSGIPVDEPNKDGTTPLMMSVQMGSAKSMEALIKLKANIKAKDKDGNTALTFVKTISEVEKSAIVEVLKAHGIKITEA